ncbi:YncE family protein [Nocardia sp. GTS18]|uniref:YncE family protein n=1 Tax=Nocardia sp. GTS18 TaxID=1778064 RepID=UPI00351AA5CF
MLSKTRLVAVLGLAVAVGISLSGCSAPRPATQPSTTSVAAPTTTDPATIGGSSIGPGPYRVEATVAVGENPRSVAIDPGTHRAYVAHYADSTDQQTVSVIDTRTRDVAARIPVGKVYPHGPQSIAVDPVTHLVYLVCGNSAGQVVVISPDTDTVTTTIDFEGDPFAVVVDPDRSTLYVANRLSRTVTAIDTITRTVRATIAVDGYPTGLAVDPNTHTCGSSKRATSPSSTRRPTPSAPISLSGRIPCTSPSTTQRTPPT